MSHIVPVFEDNYLKCDTTKISIFMSVLNKNVNRVPVHGRVEFIKHTKGKFLDARDDECFSSNENNVDRFVFNREFYKNCSKNKLQERLQNESSVPVRWETF